MKSVKMSGSAAHQETEVDVDALLAAINEISESDIRHAGSDEHPQSVSVNGTAIRS